MIRSLRAAALLLVVASVLGGSLSARAQVVVRSRIAVTPAATPPERAAGVPGGASQAAMAYPQDNGMSYDVFVRLQSAYVTCFPVGNPACALTFGEGALTLGGTGQDGTPAGLRMRVLDSVVPGVPYVSGLGYETYRNCTGGGHTRDFLTYSLAPQASEFVSFGNIVGGVTVGSTFAHASWGGIVSVPPFVPYQTRDVSLAFNTFTRPNSFNYPLCEPDPARGARARFVLEPRYRAVRFEVTVEPAQLAPGDTARVTATPIDAFGRQVGMPDQDRIITEAVDASGNGLHLRGGGVVDLHVAGSTPEKARTVTWPTLRTRAGQALGVLAPAAGPAAPERVRLRVWGFNGFRNANITGEATITLCPAGGCGGGRLVVSASADSVRTDQQAILTVRAVDGAGQALALAPETVLTYTVDGGAALGTLLVGTGARGTASDAGVSEIGASSVTASYGQGLAGLVRYAASSTTPAADTSVVVSVSGGGLVGSVRLVRPAEFDRFDVVAADDSVYVGGGVVLTLRPLGTDGETVEIAPDTQVSLSLAPVAVPARGAARAAGGSAADWGRLVQIAGADTVDVSTTAPIAWSALQSAPLHFLYDVGPLPDAATPVTVSAKAVGRLDTRGDGTFVLALPVVRLLRHDDELVPLTEADGHLMVSRFPTDRRLEDSGFRSDFTSTVEEFSLVTGPAVGDRHTYRPQVTGVERCDRVFFRLRVYRNGQPVQFRDGERQQTDNNGDGYAEGSQYYEYNAVGGRGQDAEGVCRANRFVRLVSNAPPEPRSLIPVNPTNNPLGTPVYDDEYPDRRTVRVELRDEVRVTVAIGQDRQRLQEDPASVLATWVSLPAASADEDAVRTVSVHWATPPGFSSAPGIVTARMSEDFAQAAVRFAPAGTATEYADVQNVLRLSLAAGSADGALTSGGTISVRVQLRAGPDPDGPGPGLPSPNGDPIEASFTYQPQQNLRTIADRFTGAMFGASTGRLDIGGGENRAFPNLTAYVIPTDPEAVYILVGRGNAVTFEPPQSTVDVSLAPLTITYNHLHGAMSRAVIMNARDTDPLTMDAVVVRRKTLFLTAAADSIYGLAIAYRPQGGDEVGTLTAANGFLLDARAADSVDDLPDVAGHEAGHLLLVDGLEDNDPTNLMYQGSDFWSVENYEYHKRLREHQADRIRAVHEPNPSAPSQPRLLRLVGPLENGNRLRATRTD